MAVAQTYRRVCSFFFFRFRPHVRFIYADHVSVAPLKSLLFIILSTLKLCFLQWVGVRTVSAIDQIIKKTYLMYCCNILLVQLTIVRNRFLLFRLTLAWPHFFLFFFVGSAVNTFFVICIFLTAVFFGGSL